ncbi:MAG: multicopper oxidase domain-containing protein [Alphaproteobacteria bacterium]|nr:multicopper oxidase domain-containing protein [Alphaproteobacteria bacterium]
MLRIAISAAALLAATTAYAKADAKPGTDVCPRPAAGAAVERPADIRSRNGVLKAKLSYFTTVDNSAHTLFCYTSDKGAQSPTLHVDPGDTIKLSLANAIPQGPGGAETMSAGASVCGSADMTRGSINFHFHGTNTTPACHGDNVIRTLINPGETFQYRLTIPADEPPGLYWYHHHVHSLSEAALLGGASGLIVVDGIENLQPAVAGLPERLLVLRDQQPSPPMGRGGLPPSNDVSVNYVPVIFPDYKPAVIKTQFGAQEFWRVANASADTIFDIQVQYDGAAQPLQIAALDGVPTGSQDGTRQGKLVSANDILLGPGNRAEFIVTMPSAGVSNAQLVTLNVDTGHFGDRDPERPLAKIKAGAAPVALPRIPKASKPAPRQRFEDLAQAKPTAQRLLYFSEVGSNFFITVDGQEQHVFDPNEPPAITTRVGAVEDWTIQNRVNDEHIFHIHQIHFLLEEVNGVAVPKDRRQFYDTYPVAAYGGSGDYPSIKVRMDFRGDIAGDFVYHCHILGHEDHGMMAIIRVKPAKS